MRSASASEVDWGSRARWAASALPWLLVHAAAAVLAYCVAGGPQLYDSGELAAAAVELGGSHPPGQPLHALLGHVLLFLPLGPIPARLALLSVICALLCALLAARLCAELCQELGIAPGPLRSASEAAAMLGLLLALPVLRQTLRVEVYTLALCLFLASVLLLFRWARDGRAGQLWGAALLAGLAACAHPPHALAAALTGACFGVLQPRKLLRSPRALLGAALFCVLACLFTLVYLPIRAGAGASMWGEPTSLAGFVRYVSGQAFLANVVAQDRLQLLRDYAGYLLQVNTGVPFVGALLLLSPHASAGRRSVLGMVVAAGVALVAACLQPLEARNPDNVAYLAPALALAVISGAAGFAALARKGGRLLALPGLCLLAVPPATAWELGEQLRADVPALETLSGMLIETPPPRALVVVQNDFAAAGWMMAQSVDRTRPDVALFVSGLSTSSWHWAQLGKHPGLDGRPRRAPGVDAHDRFTRGAVVAALAQVSVALERDLAGVRPSAVAGAYAVLDPRRPPDRAVHEARSMGDRWTDTLARDARRGPAGDAGAAASVVRDYFYQRSRRLLRLGLSRQALASAALALWQLPKAQRAWVRAPHDAPAPGEPYMVDDRASYLISLEDAVRQAAAELWVLSDRDGARKLLEHQVERGDPHGLLQLAHLQAFDGDHEAAFRTLAGIDTLAPALRAETDSLRAELER